MERPTAYLEHLAPLAIRVGMTSEQYWDGEPSMLTEYYRAWLQDERQRMSDMDTAAWLFGQYEMAAHQTVLHNMFAKRGAKSMEYPSMPQYYKAFLDERARKRAEEREQEKQLLEMQRRFEAMAATAARR